MDLEFSLISQVNWLRPTLQAYFQFFFQKTKKVLESYAVRSFHPNKATETCTAALKQSSVYIVLSSMSQCISVVWTSNMEFILG